MPSSAVCDGVRVNMSRNSYSSSCTQYTGCDGCLPEYTAHECGPTGSFCLSPCEVQADACRQNTSCSAFIVQSEPGAPITFNYTNLLMPATDAVQTACATVTPGGTSGVQPPAPADAVCATMLNACMNNAECRHCLQIFKRVNADLTDSITVFQNCSINGLERSRAVLNATSCGAVLDKSKFNKPGLCLGHAWSCNYAPAGVSAGQNCIADLSHFAISEHIDDDGGDDGDDDGALQGERSFHENLVSNWNGILAKPDCVAWIKVVADNRLVTAEDDDTDDDTPADTWNFSPAQSAGGSDQCAAVLTTCDFAYGFWCLYQARVCDADPTCRACLASAPTVDHATVRYTPACTLLIKPMTRACSMVTDTSSYVQYLKCSDKVATSNNMVYATSVFGALSLLGALSVLGVIYGYYKDSKSLRERILVGVFLGNAIYSVANMIPVGLQQDEPNTCGDPITPESVSAVRALWFMGKYVMVCYELFIIHASVIALQTGSVNMSRTKERAAHATCLTVGAAVFVIFFAEGATLYDTYTDTKDYGIQQRALNSYTTLVETFVQVWLVLLFAMAATWSYQRFFLFRKLKAEWDARVTEAEEAWNRDLWNRGDKYVEEERKRRRQLLDLIEEGYDEVVKPLEPYVATFILFAVPAVFMATDYCGKRSDPTEAVTSVNCQHVCELVLSLRTLATVGVYYSNPRARAQLWNLRQLFRQIWWRFRDSISPATKARPGQGRRVRISKAEDQVCIIQDLVYAAEDDGVPSGGSDGAWMIEG